MKLPAYWGLLANKKLCGYVCQNVTEFHEIYSKKRSWPRIDGRTIHCDTVYVSMSESNDQIFVYVTYVTQ